MPTQLLVLGTGCAKCNALMQFAEQAARELGLDYEIRKVTDLNQIAALGVMMTPALVVDGEVKVTGKVPSVAELKAMLSKNQSPAQG
ncbi:MAG: thioredoxin family protein [Verrucomicrobia bacterium]|nr:MAG: thioredoxin family protein [Verrucomicrobiota bacterium]